jgi:ABC-type multidrug transport system fused ATPase/permease subunit
MVKNNNDTDKLTQKDRNIASNLTYRKKHNMKKWYRFWILCGTSLVIVESFLAWIIKIPLESYIIESLVAIVAVNATFLSSTFIAAEYDPLRRAICHMGRLKSYHGINNMKSVILWIGWGISTGILAFLLGKLMFSYYFSVPILLATGFLGYCGSIVAIMVVLIPIDVHRKYHLFSSLIFFLIPLCINILVFIYLQFNISLHKYFLIPILQWIFAVLYAIGYIKKYLYTAIYQKLSLFSVYLYIIIFSTILL